MVATMASVFSASLEPGTLFLLVFVLGAVLLWTRWYHWGRRLLSAGTLLLVAIAILPVAQWVTVPLEERFPANPPLPEKVDGIIVLSGSIDLAISESRDQVALTNPAERLTSFVALARKYPDARLVFTGGRRAPGDSGYTEADAARRLLADLGLDTAHVTFEASARTTYENVVFSRNLVGVEDGETWVLVTSATHMPRAVGVFRKVGWPIIPYPVDFMTTGKSGLRLSLNVHGSLGLLARAVHEWGGLVGYRLLDRTSSLFPGPGPETESKNGQGPAGES